MSRQNSKKCITTKKEIDAIRRQITEVELLCSGNVQQRMKTCGKPGCPCRKDPNARHGPYYEWTRREKGIFRNTKVSPDVAGQLSQAIKNHRKVLRLVDKWGTKSARILLDNEP